MYFHSHRPRVVPETVPLPHSPDLVAKYVKRPDLHGEFTRCFTYMARNMTSRCVSNGPLFVCVPWLTLKFSFAGNSPSFRPDPGLANALSPSTLQPSWPFCVRYVSPDFAVVVYRQLTPVFGVFDRYLSWLMMSRRPLLIATRPGLWHSGQRSRRSGTSLDQKDFSPNPRRTGTCMVNGFE